MARLVELAVNYCQNKNIVWVHHNWYKCNYFKSNSTGFIHISMLRTNLLLIIVQFVIVTPIPKRDKRLQYKSLVYDITNA